MSLTKRRAMPRLMPRFAKQSGLSSSSIWARSSPSSRATSHAFLTSAFNVLSLNRDCCQVLCSLTPMSRSPEKWKSGRSAEEESRVLRGQGHRRPGCLWGLWWKDVCDCNRRAVCLGGSTTMRPRPFRPLPLCSVDLFANHTWDIFMWL